MYIDPGFAQFFLLCIALPIALIAFAIFLIVSTRSKKKEESKKAVEKAKEVKPQKVSFQTRLQENYYVHEISVPKSEKWIPERARYLVEQILNHSNYDCLFRITGDSKRIVWQTVLQPKHNRPSQILKLRFRLYSHRLR